MALNSYEEKDWLTQGNVTIDKDIFIEKRTRTKNRN